MPYIREFAIAHDTHFRDAQPSMILPNHKVILFPLETYVREIDFRLALAIFLLRPGRQILLGNHTDIYQLSTSVRGTVYVGKSLHNVSPTRQRECYDQAKQLDTRVIYLHEEGGVFEDDPAQFKLGLFRRLQPDWLSADDHFCAWGDVQAQTYREAANLAFASHIHVTGHPRFDLCSERFAALYDREVTELRTKYGRFVLINTNFSRFSHIDGSGRYFRPPWTPSNDVIKRHYASDYLAYDTCQFASFIQLVDRLEAQLPHLNIILRPHPSEETRFFSDIFKQFERVHVVRGGSLNAWLRACHTLVHSGCTTGIEGSLCGARIISYNPQKNSPFTKRFPNLAGRPASDQQQVLDLIEDESWCGGIRHLAPEAREELTGLFANFKEGHDSFASLVRVVEDCLEDTPYAKVEISLRNHVWKGRLQRTKLLLRSLLPEKLHFKSKTNVHARQKFSGFDLEQVEQKLSLLSGILGGNVKITRINNMILSLTNETVDD